MNEIIFLDDKDISINISKSIKMGSPDRIFLFSIYDDADGKAIATRVSREKLKELADFIRDFVENN
jgi:hypothetical protein